MVGIGARSSVRFADLDIALAHPSSDMAIGGGKRLDRDNL